MHTVRRCANCGTPQHQWRMQGQEGVRGNDGKIYCSQACAEAAESQRVGRALQEAYLEDDVKGPAEEPEQMEHKSRPMPPGQVGHGSGSTGGTSAPNVKSQP